VEGTDYFCGVEVAYFRRSKQQQQRGQAPLGADSIECQTPSPPRPETKGKK